MTERESLRCSQRSAVMLLQTAQPFRGESLRLFASKMRRIKNSDKSRDPDTFNWGLSL